MKKISKILVLALSLALVVSAFVFASAAEDAPFLVEGLYRETWADAIDNADENTPVELLNNYQVQDGETVDITQSVTINLNGYTMTGAADGQPLFNVSGEGVVLTLAGPGKININGTLVTVDAAGSSIAIDGTETIEIVSNTSDPAIVLGGTHKGKAEVKGALNYVNKVGAPLFELNSGSELNVRESNVKITSEEATSASGLALVKAGSTANVLAGAVVTNTAGYLFKIEDTDASTVATVLVESAIINLDSSDYGTLLDADDEYVSCNVRSSDITFGGYLFSSADTLMSSSGYGSDKVYTKPTAYVSVAGSTLTVGNLAKSDATVFYGNITGVISASSLSLSNSSRISAGTRLWDGECGILIKPGVRFNLEVESDTKEPMTDDDGVKIYFDPAGASNQNFSFDNLDGKPTAIYKVEALNDKNEVDSYYLVSTSGTTYTIDSSYSTNFENVATTVWDAAHPSGKSTHKIFTAAYVTSSHSSVQVLDNEDGTNRYLKFEYDQNVKYPTSSSPTYFGLKLGYGQLANVPENRLQYNQEIITFDFDITSDAVDSNGNAVYYEGSFYLMQRNQGSGWAWHTSNNLRFTTGGQMTCGNTNLIDKSLGTTVQLPKTPGVWTHITIVLDIRNESTYDYQHYSMMHFYVDGAYAGSQNIFNGNAWDLKESEIKLLTSDEFRMQTSAVSGTQSSRAICFDNFVQTFYPEGYTGDLMTIKTDKTVRLDDLKDAIYQKGYAYPDGLKHKIAATVDGTSYYDMASAMASLADGSVIELFEDVPETYFANSNLKVITNGYKFDVKSDKYYVYESQDAEGELVLDILAATNYLPIYWDIGVSYETKVPLGIAPVYTGAIPEPVVSAGTKRNLIGWSYTEGAEKPDVIRPVSKEDIDRGYIVLYPVYGITEVLVNFKDPSGNVFSSEWIPVIDSEGNYITVDSKALVEYKSGDSFGRLDLNDWMYSIFGGWGFEDEGRTELGKTSATVVPLFSGRATSQLKQSYAITNLSNFAPNLYLKVPAEEYGVKVLGVSLKEGGKYVDMKTVAIGEDNYYSFNLDVSPATFVGLAKTTAYLYFEADGETHVQECTLSPDEYFVRVLEGSTSADEKTAVMNIFRMIHNLTNLKGAAHSDLVEKYLADPVYTVYLTDLSKVTDIANAETYRFYEDEEGNTITTKEFNDAQWNGVGDALGFDDFLVKIDWNFANNVMEFHMDMSKYPNVAPGYDAAKYPGVFSTGGVMVNGSMIRCSNSTNGTTGVIKLTLATCSYDTDKVYAYNAFTDVFVTFAGIKQDNGTWDRTTLVPQSIYGTRSARHWNLTAQINHLENRIAAGESGLAANLEAAKIIYIANWSVGEVLNQNGVVNTPLG